MSRATLNKLPAAPAGKTGWPWTEASEPLPETMPNGESWPKISIVTPSYNQGQFIEETIRSVLLQGYPNLEYVVIDGGSTDESVEIIRKYERWIDYWVSESDRGQSHAINKGLQRCTGEIWNWINSDDLLTKGALGVIGENMGDSDVLIGPGWVFDRQDAWWRQTSNFTFLNLIRGYDGCSFYQQGVWLKTEQVKACGMIDESYEYAMDRELYVRYTYRYPEVTHVDFPLAKFRHHPTSKSLTATNDFFKDHVRIAEKVLRSDMSHIDLETVCRDTIRKLQWKVFVDDMRDGVNKSKIRRIARTVLGMLRDPKVRMNRYTLGAIRLILTE